MSSSSSVNNKDDSSFSTKPLASEADLHEILDEFGLQKNNVHLKTAWEAYKYSRHQIKIKKANSNFGIFNKIYAEKKRNEKKLEKLSQDENADEASIRQLENEIQQNDKKLKTIYKKKLTPDERKKVDKKLNKSNGGKPINDDEDDEKADQQQQDDEEETTTTSTADMEQQQKKKNDMEYKRKYMSLKEKYQKLREENEALKKKLVSSSSSPSSE